MCLYCNCPPGLPQPGCPLHSTGGLTTDTITITIPDLSDIPTGWQCPLCMVVHAPSVKRCSCAAGAAFIPTPLQTEPIDTSGTSGNGDDLSVISVMGTEGGRKDFCGTACGGCGCGECAQGDGCGEGGHPLS